jgi:single-strand DNA-binding protein
LNSILIEGNVVRDAEIKNTPNGGAVCTFSVGVNRSYKGKDGEYQKDVSFFNVETWGKLAEVCAEKCEKGRGVRAVGRLKQDRWQDGEGKNREKIFVLAEHVEFKNKNAANADQENSSYPF